MSNVVLVTGVMGSGKTLKVVADLVQDLELNEKREINEKRTYYADISGLKIDGIEPSPYDWRTTSDHSYIIYDEAQLNSMFARKRGQSHLAVQELTLARKRGHKIIFITQAPNRLHQDILDVVGEHYHLHRPYGAKLATCYMWRNQVALRPLGRTALSIVENKFLFTYPKKCFDYYESAQVADDGFKLKVPPKTLFLLALPVLLIGYAVYGYFFDKKVTAFINPSSSKQVASAVAVTSAPAETLLATSATALTSATPATVMPVQQATQGYYDPLTKGYITDLNQVPTNVMSFKGKCNAFNYNAQPVQISQVACNAYLKNKGLLPVIGQGSQAPTVSAIPMAQLEAPPKPEEQVSQSSGGITSGQERVFSNGNQEYIFK